MAWQVVSLPAGKPGHDGPWVEQCLFLSKAERPKPCVVFRGKCSGVVSPEVKLLELCL